MADTRLSVELIADVANFEKELQSALTQLKKFAKDGDKEANDFLGRKLPKASNSAAFALTNLGRVASDAPFGFIAIQNNIGPLIDSFGYLAKEAKETGTSLTGALGAALTGPAGVGLAIAAVTAAVTVYTMWQQKSASETKKNAGATKEYADTLNDLTKAQLIGAKNAQGDINQLNQLYKLATNTAASTRDRKAAVDELQQQYPAYFKNIKDEVVLAGGASEAYIRLKDSILQVAQARAAEGILEKNQGRQIENTQKITDLEAERLKTVQELSLAQKVAAEASAGLAGNTQSSLTGGGGQANSALAATGRVEELQRAINDNQQKQNNLRTDTNKLATRNLDLVNKINEAAAKNGVAAITGSFTDGQGGKKASDKRASSVAYGVVSTGVLVDAQDQLTTSLRLQNIAASDAMDGIMAFTDAQLTLASTSQQNIDLFNAQNEALNSTVGIIGGGLTDAFASMLTTGQASFSAFGQLILGLIAKIVAATLAALALAAIISLIPGLGVAGGFSKTFSGLASGLSGISGLGTILGSGIPKLANGGIVSSPTLAMIGEGKDSEAVIPLPKLDAMMNNAGGSGRVSFEIQGDKLIGVLDRANKTKNRTGK